MDDPLYTESYWNKDPTLETFLRGNSKSEKTIFGLALAMTTVAGAFVWYYERILSRLSGHLVTFNTNM